MNIGFFVPWPLNGELTAYWSMWATVATAAGTFLLAFFAWKAWVAAKETLLGQQSAEAITATSKYVTALHTLARVPKSAPAQYLPPTTGLLQLDLQQRNDAYKPFVDQLIDEAEIAGGLWRAFHKGHSTILKPLIEGESILCEAQDWWKNPATGLESRSPEQYSLNAKFGREFSRYVFEWQTSPERRESLSKIIDKLTESFISDSPCNPGKAALSSKQSVEN